MNQIWKSFLAAAELNQRKISRVFLKTSNLEQAHSEITHD